MCRCCGCTYGNINSRFVKSLMLLRERRKLLRTVSSSSSTTTAAAAACLWWMIVRLLGNSMIYVWREIDKLLVTIIQNCTRSQSVHFFSGRLELNDCMLIMGIQLNATHDRFIICLLHTPRTELNPVVRSIDREIVINGRVIAGKGGSQLIVATSKLAKCVIQWILLVVPVPADAKCHSAGCA